MCWGFDRGPTKVKLGEGRPSGRFRSHHKVSKPLALQVVCGRSHVAAVATTGAVYVWDEQLSPRMVRLPGVSVTSVAAARYTTLAVTSAGDVFQWDEHWHAGWVPKPKKLGGLRQVVFATAADQHCAALLAVQRPLSASTAQGGVGANAATDGTELRLVDAHAEACGGESDDDAADALSDSTEHSTESSAESSAEKSADDDASERGDVYTPGLGSDYAPHAYSPRAESSGDKGARVPTLKLLCERALTATANPRNVLQLLYTADVIQAEAMRAFCAEMVSLNLPLLLCTELWAHLPQNLLQLLRETLRPRCAELLHASANASRLAAILREEAAAEEAAAATARAGVSVLPFGSPTGQTPLSAASRARQLRKKLKQIDELEKRRTLGGSAGRLTAPQRVKLESKAALVTALEELLAMHPEAAAPTPSPSALPAAAPADCPPLDATLGATDAATTPTPASARPAATGTDSAIPSVAGQGVSLLLPVTLRSQRPPHESECGGRGGEGASASPKPLAPSDMLDGQLPQNLPAHARTSGAPASKKAASGGKKKSSWSALALAGPSGQKEDTAEPPAARALQSSIKGWGYREMGATPASASTAPLLAEIQREQQQQQQRRRQAPTQTVEGRLASGGRAAGSASVAANPVAEAEESAGSRPMQLPILHFVRQPSSTAKENANVSRDAAREGPVWGAAAPASQPSRSLHDILAEEEAQRRRIKQEEQRELREQRERAREAAARERERAAGLRPAWGGAATAAAACDGSQQSAASLLDIVAEQVAEDERRKAARSQRQAASAWTAASPKPLLPWSSPAAHASPPTSWGFLPEPPVYSLAQIQTEELIQTLEAPATPSAPTQSAALATPGADSATKATKKAASRESDSAARAHSKRASNLEGAAKASGGHRGRHRGKAAADDKAAAEDTATTIGGDLPVRSQGATTGAKTKAAAAKAKGAARLRDPATPSASRDAVGPKPKKHPRKPAPSAGAAAGAVADAGAATAVAEPCARDKPRRERHGRHAPRGPTRTEPGTLLRTEGGARAHAECGSVRGGTELGGAPDSSESAASGGVPADGDGGARRARADGKQRGSGDDGTAFEGGGDGGRIAGARKHLARRSASGSNMTPACSAAAVGA